jgi:large subunit ribosomal protein L4
MKVKVLNIEGKDTGKSIELNDSIFGIEPNEHAVYLDVKQYMANKRQGTHKSKERAEIAKSTRKVKKQKGTGTARMGSLKSPVLRGGGRVFGPKPRDYSFKLNKKLKVLARKSAFSYKAINENILVLEDFTFDTPKTKSIINLQKNLEVNNKKSLLVLSGLDNNIYMSARNLSGFEVMVVSELNTYAVTNANKLVFVESAVSQLNNMFSN